MEYIFHAHHGNWKMSKHEQALPMSLLQHIYKTLFYRICAIAGKIMCIIASAENVRSTSCTVFYIW